MTNPSMNEVSTQGLKKSGGFAVKLIVIMSFFYIVAYLALAGARMQYPYELDYTESANAAELAQVVAGKPAYTAPTVHYVPLVYTPLNFHVAAMLSHITPGSYFALRLTSILGTIITTLLMVFIALRAKAPLWAIAAAAGTFLGAFTRCMFIQDTGRVDSLALAFGMGALALLFEARKTLLIAAAAGLLAGLGFLTKQTMVVFIGVPFLWLMLQKEWGRALVFAFTSLLSIVALLAWLGMLFNPWFYFFVFGLESSIHFDLAKLLLYAPAYLILTLPAGLLIGLLGSCSGASGWKNALRRWLNDPWGVMMLAFAGMSLLAKAKFGGGENVFLPVVAIGALQIGKYSGKLLEVRPRQILLLLVVQLVVLYYPPTLLWPTQADRDAGDRLVEMIKKVPGDVYIPAFPEYAVRAGKPWYAHYTMVCGNLKYNHDLREAFGKLIRTQQFGAVIPRLDVEAQDRGICEVPYLDEYYEPREAVLMPPRPSIKDILLGRPSLAGIAHGGKFSQLYVPRHNMAPKAP